MPQPTPGDVHVDAALTNILVAFTQDPGNFIADRVFPMVPVQHQSDRFHQYDRGDWNRAVAQKRGPATASAGGGWNDDNTAQYFCDVWAVHKDVDDQTRANQDPAIDLERDSARWTAQQIMIRKDKEWAATAFTAGVWTGSTTGGDITPATLWDAAGGDPIVDIDAQAVSIAMKTGRWPNKLVFSMDTWIKVKNAATVTDRIKHTQTGIVTEAIFASLVGIEEVMVIKAIETTSAEAAAITTAFVGGSKDALLLYTAKAPSVLEPTAGYTFTWNGYLGMQAGMRVKNFRMEEIASDRIEGEAAFDPFVVSAVAGVFFSNAIS